MDVLKKLEAGNENRVEEVEGERESETEVTVATLNAEMLKNMSEMAKAEADAAGKNAAAMTKPVSVKETKREGKWRGREKERSDEEDGEGVSYTGSKT
ncbi:hypothetical protein Bca4012_025001 [Brassica carinata]|uniref:Uncharacterized protein n=1 Tax=Brassica carinata TaxID=52824 RepID=A0A8X7VGC0_BRACI|nr:hypothetical protein Bca52824_022042 [Brassica carinata]